MSYWAIRIGIAFIILGGILLSPISDFLPVDFWVRLQSIFFPSSSSTRGYLRVVPLEPNNTLELTLIGLGLLLIAIGLFLRHKK